MTPRTYAGLILGALLAFNALGSSASAAVPSPAAIFAKKAAQAGMTEVQLAGLALRKSTNPEVDAFARRMNADHSKANAQLMSIAQQQGLTPPNTLGMKNEALMHRLQNETGATFDNAYLKSQLPAHRQVLALFEAEASGGQDPELVRFAKQTIPTLQEHIAMDKREISKLDSGKRMSMR